MTAADRGARAVLCAAAAATLLAGCSFFDDDDGGETTVSVFDLAPGDCVLAPDEVVVELTEVTTVPCEQPHELEAYAVVDYPTDGGAEETDAAGSSFPGDASLKDFADGVCADEFAGYVGVDYRDSELWFTYLVPSARSWQAEGDRAVLCLITTTGEELTQSVAGTQW